MNQNFSTYDLGLATVLITTGHKLLELDKSNSRKICFIFEYKKSIEKVINDYWNDEIKLPAQTLFNNQKMLKNRLYSNT